VSQRCSVCGYIDELCRCFGTGPLPVKPQDEATAEPSTRDDFRVATAKDSAVASSWGLPGITTELARKFLESADAVDGMERYVAMWLLRMVDELRAKLAEAERLLTERKLSHSDMAEKYSAERERAEAAEARVRELLQRAECNE
jgi:hypothetical protein